MLSQSPDVTTDLVRSAFDNMSPQYKAILAKVTVEFCSSTVVLL
jgi:hypothetical protein